MLQELDESEFIPCLFLKGQSTDQLLLHFHANGEDIGQTIGLLRRVQREFGFNVACMEYAGYGVYKKYKSKLKQISERNLRDWARG